MPQKWEGVCGRGKRLPRDHAVPTGTRGGPLRGRGCSRYVTGSCPARSPRVLNRTEGSNRPGSNSDAADAARLDALGAAALGNLPCRVVPGRCRPSGDRPRRLYALQRAALGVGQGRRPASPGLTAAGIGGRNGRAGPRCRRPGDRPQRGYAGRCAIGPRKWSARAAAGHRCCQPAESAAGRRHAAHPSLCRVRDGA